MATKKLDCKGLRCPRPIMKMTAALVDLKEGDILEAVSDCSTFEEDVRKWSGRLQKNLLSVTDDEDGAKRVTVRI